MAGLINDSHCLLTIQASFLPHKLSWGGLVSSPDFPHSACTPSWTTDWSVYFFDSPLFFLGLALVGRIIGPCGAATRGIIDLIGVVCVWISTPGNPFHKNQPSYGYQRCSKTLRILGRPQLVPASFPFPFTPPRCPPLWPPPPSTSSKAALTNVRSLPRPPQVLRAKRQVLTTANPLARKRLKRFGNQRMREFLPSCSPWKFLQSNSAPGRTRSP